MFFNKYYNLKMKGKTSLSDSTESLFGNEITNPVQEIDEQMLNLSLTSKQEIDSKMSEEDMQISINMTSSNETPLMPDYIDYFQHDYSDHYNQWNLYHQQRGVSRRFMKQSLVQLQGMFSRTRGGHRTLPSGNFNHNFNFEPYQQGLSMQRHPAELENFKSPEDQSYKKTRRGFIRFHYRIFKGRHARDRTHDSALLLPREN